MIKIRASTLWAVTALLLGLATCQAALANRPVEVFQGSIETIDYGNHAITVNHQSYKVSPRASFTGVTGFESLQQGMQVRFILATPPSGSEPMIMNLTVMAATD